MTNLAYQAKELLDAAFENGDIDKESPYWGHPENFLKDQGYKFEREADHEDTIYGNPRYEETNVRYVFSDGSICDEEFEKTWENAADLEDHWSDMGEAAHEQMISDFHAGDSGFKDSRENQLESWKQHQELKGRPTTSHAADFDEPMPETETSPSPTTDHEV